MHEEWSKNDAGSCHTLGDQPVQQPDPDPGPALRGVRYALRGMSHGVTGESCMREGSPQERVGKPNGPAQGKGTAGLKDLRKLR